MEQCLERLGAMLQPGAAAGEFALDCGEDALGHGVFHMFRASTTPRHFRQCFQRCRFSAKLPSTGKNGLSPRPASAARVDPRHNCSSPNPERSSGSAPSANHIVLAQSNLSVAKDPALKSASGTTRPAAVVFNDLHQNPVSDHYVRWVGIAPSKQKKSFTCKSRTFQSALSAHQ